jgi:hypothetical protein
MEKGDVWEQPGRVKGPGGADANFCAVDFRESR